MTICHRKLCLLKCYCRKLFINFICCSRLIYAPTFRWRSSSLFNLSCLNRFKLPQKQEKQWKAFISTKRLLFKWNEWTVPTMNFKTQVRISVFFTQHQPSACEEVLLTPSWPSTSGLCNRYFLNWFYYFSYWLHWVFFVAALRPSVDTASVGAFSSCGAQTSHCGGFSGCRALGCTGFRSCKDVGSAVPVPAFLQLRLNSCGRRA